MMRTHKARSVIDTYEVEMTIGKGNFGKVKQVTCTRRNKKYAMKLLKIKKKVEAQTLNEFESEYKTLTKLEHKHILKTVDFKREGTKRIRNTTESVAYMVTELAEGGDLFDFVCYTGKFTEAFARYFFHQIIKGVEHMHSHSFVHRDLKLENVLVDQNFELKLADFGYAINAATHKRFCDRGVGTKSYAAPEILIKGTPYDAYKVDIFNLGVMLFIMVIGIPPFNIATCQDSWYKYIFFLQFKQYWTNVQRSGRTCSEEFQQLVQKMLDFEPKNRPTIEEIKKNSWFKGTIPPVQEISEEYDLRKSKKDQKYETERLEEKMRKIEVRIFSDKKI